MKYSPTTHTGGVGIIAKASRDVHLGGNNYDVLGWSVQFEDGFFRIGQEGFLD